MSILSPEKEAWAEQMAREISRESGTGSHDLVGARWACLWIDRYKELTEGIATRSKTKEQMARIIEQARRESLTQATWVPLYPASQQPIMSVLNSATEVFCLSFREQYSAVKSLVQQGRKISRYA